MEEAIDECFLSACLRRIAYWPRRSEHSDDVADEMAFHRAMIEDQMRASGMSVAEAHDAARSKECVAVRLVRRYGTRTLITLRSIRSAISVELPANGYVSRMLSAHKCRRSAR